MSEDRTIGIAIPSWQRSEMTVNSFIDVLDDERISEITIVDDASDNEIYEELQQMVASHQKVRLFRNKTNQDCYFNKARSLCYSNNDWCILLDSDNKIGKDYIDKLFEIEKWEDDTIYTPCFAMPHFDFRNYADLLISKENVKRYIDLPLFETMLNASNYFVNRNKYLEVWDEETNPVTSDSIFMIYRWLESGGKVKVVNGLQYNHLVHNGHYRTNVHRTPVGFHQNVLNKLRQMA